MYTCYFYYISKVDHDPDGIIPQRRLNHGADIAQRLPQEYNGERMNFEENENEELGGEQARNQFIEGSFGENMLA